VIDVNVFLGPYPWRQLPGTSPEEVLGAMDRVGIGTAWVSHLPSLFWKDPVAGNGWLFDTVARRGSPMVAGTEISRMLKEAGSEVLFNGWEVTAEIAQQRAKEVLEAWGFPKPK